MKILAYIIAIGIFLFGITILAKQIYLEVRRYRFEKNSPVYPGAPDHRLFTIAGMIIVLVVMVSMLTLSVHYINIYIP